VGSLPKSDGLTFGDRSLDRLERGLGEVGIEFVERLGAEQFLYIGGARLARLF